MLTIRHIDRETGEPRNLAYLSAATSLRSVQIYCDHYGWDFEIVGYEPS